MGAASCQAAGWGLELSESESLSPSLTTVLPFEWLPGALSVWQGAARRFDRDFDPQSVSQMLRLDFLEKRMKIFPVDR